MVVIKMGGRQQTRFVDCLHGRRSSSLSTCTAKSIIKMAFS